MKYKNGKLQVRFKAVAMIAYGILLLPILIFFIGWLKWYYALLFSVALLIGIVAVYRTTYLDNQETIDISLKALLLVAVIFAAWVLITGNCGVSVSNYDTPWRRAILRDLVNCKWPVHYEQTSNYLVYYHVFWMVPAVVGKILGWHAALITQAIWLWLIIMVSFFLISFVIRANENKVFLLISIMIVGWSGLNVLGHILMQIFGWSLYDFDLSLNESYCDALFNGESFNFYYRSNEDFLCENYNQLLIWIAVPLMLKERKIRNYAFIGILLLPYSPWGVIGIAIMMIIDAVAQGIGYLKKKQVKQLLCEIFSMQNICVLLSVAVVFLLYFSGTSRLNSSGGNFGILTLSKFDFPRIVGLLVFWLCEFGIYYMIMWKKNKKDPLFVSCLPVLMVIPICWAGSIWGRDFCMNVSLPLLYMLMIYMIVYVKDHIMGKVLTVKNLLVVCCLFIAFMTPVFDWGRKTQIMIANKSIAVTNDSQYSFSDKSGENYANFLVDEQGTFRYIAK